MARILFVENRGKTAFWSEVAGRLEEIGHDISWIVQNRAYRPPARFKQSLIPIPKKNDLVASATPAIISTERGRQYFNSGSSHYQYYEMKIAAIIESYEPDVVIGEPTLFHELLTVDLCRAKGIPYLHPTMNRYPAGRFSVFEGDTQIPSSESGDVWNDSRVEDLTKKISHGAVLPSYMKKANPVIRQIAKGQRLTGLAKTITGWCLGERFNTPSPAQALLLGRGLKANLAIWDKLACLPDGDGPVVLYPLQMQPEANIDVWGRPFSDQVAVVREILDALPLNGSVAIKANPKSKWEVSNELLRLAERNTRVVLLPRQTSMVDAQKHSIGAITVSGTVGYEAVFGNGRCISLRHPIIRHNFPNMYAETPAQATELLLSSESSGTGDFDSGKRLLRNLVASSFEGVINEPLFDRGCMNANNLRKVAEGLQKVILANKIGVNS